MQHLPSITARCRPDKSLGRSMAKLTDDGIMKLTFGSVTLTEKHKARHEDLDAMGKPGSGLAKGHLVWPGSFDQCNGIPNSKYCLAGTEINNNPAAQGLLGVCVPKECKEDYIRIVLPAVFSMVSSPVFSKIVSFPENGNLVKTYGKPVVCNEKLTYTTGAIVMITVCSILGFMCLLGTVCEMVQNFLQGPPLSKNKDFMPVYYDTNDEEDEKLDSVPYKHSDEQPLLFSGPLHGGAKSRAVHWMVQFLLCFSIIKNTKTVLSTTNPPGAITAAHGIRTLSMWWVILGHTYSVGAQTPIDNSADLLPLLKRWTFLPIANGFYSVDSFFLLSGLLVAYLSFRRYDKNGKLPLLQFYVHRFLRLTPSYLFVILILMYVYVYFGSGPLWTLLPGSQLISPCKKYWWTNILYINNFYPTKLADECLGWGWYLANDMQFHIISPILLYLMYKFKLEGTFVWNSFVCLMSFIVTGVIISYYNLNTIATGDINIGRNGNKDHFTDYVYTKPYTRIAPYLVGLVLGYLLHYKYRLKGKFTWLIVLIGWCMAFVFGLAVVYGVRKEFKKHSEPFTRTENIFYGTFGRFTWGVALAWVIYACHFGYGGIIDKILSWKAFVPLSRLTFGAYLLHPLVLILYYDSLQAVRHYTDMSLGFHYISFLAVSYIAAYILAVWIEFPFANLEKLVFRFK